MGSWIRHVQPFSQSGDGSRKKPRGESNRHYGKKENLQSWLPEIYAGSSERMVKYQHYDTMDRDTEVNTALDTISEFSTQMDEVTELPFILRWNVETKSTANVISKYLRQWCKINDWEQRLRTTFRNAIKYGDQAFVRDPQTYELTSVHAPNLLRAVANETHGKELVLYEIKDISPNLAERTATSAENMQAWSSYGMGSPAAFKSFMTGVSNQPTSYLSSSGMLGNQETYIVDASFVVHMALTDGMEPTWPYGVSVLEPVYKIYKQKELLEDALLIYRMQRAPQRRVFYVDVAESTAAQAEMRVEKFKNEIHQRRIPTKAGGGETIMDAQYNPLSILDDIFFARTSDGQGSSVDTIGGDIDINQIDDLKYFAAKMARALKIPSSYLSVSIDGEATAYNDGRLGNAFIEEYRFTQLCKRLQNTMRKFFDREFKLFVKHRGYQGEISEFEIDFVEPQNFSKYREIEINQARVNVFNSILGAAESFMSKRFLMDKYLGLTEEEILRNEKLLEEEKGMEEDEEDKMATEESRSGLGSVGMSSLGGGSSGFASLADDGDGGDGSDFEGGFGGPGGGDEGGGDSPLTPDPEI